MIWKYDSAIVSINKTLYKKLYLQFLDPQISRT